MINPLLTIHSSLFTAFGSAEGPHIAIAPEKILQIGNLEITNSNLYGWIVAVIIGFLLVRSVKKIGLMAKGGFAQIVEIGTEFVLNLLESNLGSRKKAVKYAPIFASLFFFILFNNWLGLLPGVGLAIEINGAAAFRPFTADLNGTIALAIFGVATVQYLAIKERGLKNHLMHYFGGNLKNPINLFVGFLEMFGELTRVISLSLRLFLNILIGEILISIFTFVGKNAAPITTLPFIGMEIFVGLVQAFIFTLLCITYLSIATKHDTHEPDHSLPKQLNSVKELGV